METESEARQLLREFYQLLDPIRLDRQSDDKKLCDLMARADKLLNQPPDRPVKTVKLSELSILRMTTGGEKKYSRVVINGVLKEWVGIGWIDIRRAKTRDLTTYPMAVED